MIIVYITCGKTGTGKTSIAKYLASVFDLVVISQGELKREVVQQNSTYTSKHSLNEELRNQGYKIAIKLCESHLKMGNSVIIDASFHKRLRREWLVEILTKYNVFLVILFMKCDNLAEIERRINLRKTEIKNANNQADSMEVYFHISHNFENPALDEFSVMQAAIFEIDTYNNVLVDLKKTSNAPEADILAKLKQTINYYLTQKRNEN